MSANGYSFADRVKVEAAGRWVEVFRRLAPELAEALDAGPQKHVLCPLPDHDDDDPSFRLDKPQEGRAVCSCGGQDGFGMLMKLRGWKFMQSVEQVAEVLGITNTNGKPAISIVEQVAAAKRIKPESARLFGATEAEHVTKSGRRFPACRVPMFDAQGNECSHCDVGLKGKASKGINADGKPRGAFLPGRKPQAGESVIACEGWKDASAYTELGYLAVGLPGDVLDAKLVELFRGCHVTIMPDRTVDAEAKAQLSAGRLFGVAASVRVGTLPLAIGSDEGDDARDVLKKSDGEALLRQAVENAQPWTVKPGETPKKMIFVGADEGRVTDEAVEAFASTPGVYQRGGMLVHVVRRKKPPKAVRSPPDAPYIVTMPPPRVREVLADAANWVIPAGEKVKRTHPPDWCVQQVIARGQWENVLPIEGIVETPVMLVDGSILQKPGYDPGSGLFLETKGQFPPIKDNPTRDDALAARDAILEIVEDFPFEADEHRSAWFAAMLTPAARFAFSGPSPLFATDANVPGSGKSMLVDCIATVHTGRIVARTSAPKDDEECRKRITSIVIAGESLMLFDNVAKTFGWPSLDAVLTGDTWSDRVLGESRMTGAMPLTTVWYCTGNNIIFAGDVSRRTLHIRLESPEEKPEERTDFKHPNLLPWVKAERHRLASAALTILRAYHVASRPKYDIPAWGSFQSWSDLVRMAAVWLELEDPGKTRQQLRAQSDQSAGLLRMLMAGWEEIDPAGAGLTVAEAISLLDKHPNDYPTFRAALAELTVGNAPNTRSIGMKLHHLRRRVVGGKRFDSRDEHGTKAWFVESTEGLGCSKGTSFHLYAGENSSF